MNIVKLSIVRPTAVVVTFVILVFFGLFSYSNLSQELFPPMKFGAISVSTVYPGAAPSDVESSVTKKIEDALSSVEGIKTLKSTSMEGFSLTMIELKTGTDENAAIQSAQRKINAVRSEFPAGVKEPALENFDMNSMPIMAIGATSRMPETEFFDLMKNEVKPALERIPGITHVELLGGDEREIQINLNEERMSAYGLSAMDVGNTLIASNLDFPAGKIKDDDSETLIRLSGKYESVSDIENVILKTQANGAAVKVKDVAEVADAHKETAVINRVNGAPSIGITVQKQADANAVTLSDAVLETIHEMERRHKPNGLQFTVASNQSEFTREATNSVVQDLLLAILLVAACMVLFLHSMRNAFIVSVAIPASLVSTFIAMYLLGFSLNLMSLLALTLVVGILVDDAIVVIENIHRHLEMGKPRLQAAYDGIREIGATVVSITLVLVVVFVPISLSQGTMSDLFRQFAVTIAVATLFSLFTSFTLVALMASRMGKTTRLNPKKLTGKIVHAFESRIDRLATSMTKLLKWSFTHKLVTLSVTVALFAASLFLVVGGFIGSEFAAGGDQGAFYIYLELPKDASIEQSNFAAQQAESIIKSNPAVEIVFTTVGASENGQAQSYLSEIQVKMVPRDRRNITSIDLSREVKLTLQGKLAGVKVTSATTDIMGVADQAPIQLFVTGQNQDTVMAVARQILDRMATVKGVMDAKLSVETGDSEIRIIPDRAKMSMLGVPFDALGNALFTAFSGNTDAKFRQQDNEYDINVRLDRFDRKNFSDIENFSVQNVSGQQVRLKQLAAIEESVGASRLERRNRAPSVAVGSQAAGRPTGDIGADVQQAIEELRLPPSVSIEYGGEMESQSEGFGTLGMALLISIVLVYLIMVALYNSYIYPLVVLFSIPLAMIGALFALGLAMQSLNVFTILGIIMLVGLVAKNAILVVDFTNQLKADGMELKAALLEATHKRFRPIIMTTLTTIVGMAPIALAKGAGAEWKNGLAWVVIGGLASSMILTLVIVPLVYYGFDRIGEKWGGKKKAVKVSEI
ncbi:MAG: efflux RND transporter permease subunit [Prevotellaceae bacterium]|jgi:HAE1 family hydrophobic/amphiphilic exporter-1|nr:efflux RND transporter permease subunit [Prevotellaceae bacterium]